MRIPKGPRAFDMAASNSQAKRKVTDLPNGAKGGLLGNPEESNRTSANFGGNQENMPVEVKHAINDEW